MQISWLWTSMHIRVHNVCMPTCMSLQLILIIYLNSTLYEPFLFTSTSSNRNTVRVLKDSNDHTKLWYHSFTMKLCYKLWKVQLKLGKLELGKENVTHPTPCISNICPRLLPRSSTTDPMCSSGTSTVAICNQSIFSNKFFLKSG